MGRKLKLYDLTAPTSRRFSPALPSCPRPTDRTTHNEYLKCRPAAPRLMLCWSHLSVSSCVFKLNVNFQLSLFWLDMVQCVVMRCVWGGRKLTKPKKILDYNSLIIIRDCYRNWTPEPTQLVELPEKPTQKTWLLTFHSFSLFFYKIASEWWLCWVKVEMLDEKMKME